MTPDEARTKLGLILNNLGISADIQDVRNFDDIEAGATLQRDLAAREELLRACPATRPSSTRPRDRKSVV